MKKVILMSLLFFSIQNFSQNLKVMTYNIRLDIASDLENSWPNRKEKVVEIIIENQPDIFGIQEGLPHQVRFLNSTLVNYSEFGKGRDGGQLGEHSSVFYDKNKFELIEFDTFWLSETPEIISKGWDAALNRICTYGLFKDKTTNKFFWVFNTHFDHIGEIARKKSVELIHQQIDTLNTLNYPVILMGDFNLEPETEPISYLNRHFSNSKKVAKKIINFGGTFNGFKFDEPVTREIDYVFITKKGLKVLNYSVVTKIHNNKFPSDHFPVLVELQFD